MRLFLKYWSPVILWCAFIFYCSTDTFSASNTSLFFKPVMLWLFPGASPKLVQEAHWLVRKLGHISNYVVLSFLLMRALRGEKREKWEWRWAFWALVTVGIYALSDEFHQAFVPSRGPSLSDVLIDFFGGICSVFSLYLYSILRTRAQRRAPNYGPLN